MFQISRQRSPIFSNLQRGSPADPNQQHILMALPYVEQFKFDEVLNRYNLRNGKYCELLFSKSHKINIECIQCYDNI